MLLNFMREEWLMLLLQVMVVGFVKIDKEWWKLGLVYLNVSQVF